MRGFRVGARSPVRGAFMRGRASVSGRVGESCGKPYPELPVPQVEFYSTAICPYCLAAKNFLKSKGLAYREVRIDLDAVARKDMMDKAKRSSVPQIFVNGVHVGGFDDMVALDRAGKFTSLLEQTP